MSLIPNCDLERKKEKRREKEECREKVKKGRTREKRRTGRREREERESKTESGGVAGNFLSKLININENGSLRGLRRKKNSTGEHPGGPR